MALGQLRDLDQLPATVSVEEACALLGLSRRSAYRAVERGELPVLRFGRRLLVPTAKLLVLLGLRPDGPVDGASEPAQQRLGLTCPQPGSCRGLSHLTRRSPCLL